MSDTELTTQLATEFFSLMSSVPVLLAFGNREAAAKAVKRAGLALYSMRCIGLIDADCDQFWRIGGYRTNLPSYWL